MCDQSRRLAARAGRLLRKKASQTKVAYDVATASAETISHRTAMMGRAMIDPAALIADFFTFCMKATDFSDAIVDAGAKSIHRAVVGNSRRLAKTA